MVTKAGRTTHHKLQGLLYCYHDQRKRGLIPAADDFDATTMRLAVKKIDAEKAGKKLDLTDLYPDKIEMDLKWWPLKKEFLKMANNVIGVDKNPIYYVISTDQPAVWVPPNVFKQKIYQLPHTGAVQNRDKTIVWGKNLKAYLNTTSWEWINEFEATEDSSSAWKFLVDK